MSRAAIQSKICKSCNIRYSAFRSDSEYCSGGCRQKLNRASNPERSEALRRSGGLCEVCYLPGGKTYYREGKVLCGKCHVKESHRKFYVRVPNPGKGYAKNLFKKRKMESECQESVN